VPPSLGVGLPSDGNSLQKNRGLQEERVERDAWKGILNALARMKARHDAAAKENADASSSAMQE
jgi:hypothetical protein